MIEVVGKYTSALVHTDEAEDYALAQIRQLCDQPAFAGSKIRIMPDVHPGKVGPIGFTATATNQVLPATIGVDIGCGILLAKISAKRVAFQKLDVLLRERVPSGFALRTSPHRMAESFDYERLSCHESIRIQMAERGIGTLGGGNHFIEIDRDASGNLYVAIHTGSRHLGKEVAEYYQSLGHRKLKAMGMDIPYELVWLEGEEKEAYLQDAAIVQEYAALNRRAILDEMVKGMKWKVEEVLDCPHNYVTQWPSGASPVSSEASSLHASLIRKGAISAKAGEKVIIPVNMRDGILLGTGKGNPEWNESAPHGAGRILRRDSVRNTYTVSQYKQEMKGIYSTCIGRETLDEAPFAYHDLAYIQSAITQTVQVEEVLCPIYNFKAGGDA